MNSPSYSPEYMNDFENGKMAIIKMPVKMNLTFLEVLKGTNMNENINPGTNQKMSMHINGIIQDIG